MTVYNEISVEITPDSIDITDREDGDIIFMSYSQWLVVQNYITTHLFMPGVGVQPGCIIIGEDGSVKWKDGDPYPNDAPWNVIQSIELKPE